MDYKDRVEKFRDLGYYVVAVGRKQPGGAREVVLERRLRDGVMVMVVQDDGGYRELDYSPGKDAA
jgi:hypothetical protein